MVLDHKAPLNSNYSHEPTTAVLFDGWDFTHLQASPGDGSEAKAAGAMAAAAGAGAGYGVDRLAKGRVGSLSKASPRRGLQNISKSLAKDVAKKSTVSAGKKIAAASARKLGARAAALAVAAAVPGPGWAAAAGIAMTVAMGAIFGENRILKGLGALFGGGDGGVSTDTPPSPPTTNWLPLFDPPE